MTTQKSLTPEEAEAFCLKVLALCDTNGTTTLMTAPHLWASEAAKLVMTIEAATVASSSGDRGWTPERTAALIKANVLLALAEEASQSYYSTYRNTSEAHATTERDIARAMDAPIIGKAS